MRNHAAIILHNPVTLIFDLLTSGSTHAKVLPWSICVASLGLIAQAVFTRDSVAIARICHGNAVRLSVCLSVCLSVTRVDQPKTVEARITQFSPYSSPIPLVFRG